jgi:hypothetical protein
MILTEAGTTIGARHHGRRLSVKVSECAKVEDGWLAEQARGYLVVSEVPNYCHGMQIEAINGALRLQEHFEGAYTGSRCYVDRVLREQGIEVRDPVVLIPRRG